MNPVLSPSARQKREKPRDESSVAADETFVESGDMTRFEADILDRPFSQAAVVAPTESSNPDTNPPSQLRLNGLFGTRSKPKPEGDAPKSTGLWSPLNWISDKLMAREGHTSLSGGPRAVYGLSVRAVMGANAQMETYNPPHSGEFTQRLGLKWGILRPRLMLFGKFWLRLAPGTDDRPGDYTVFLRTRLPLLPVLPWVVLVSLPAAIPIVINQIIGFSWHGPALATGWVAITALPLIRSYISTCRSTAAGLNATILEGLTPEVLTASQMDRSSIVALVPPRPASFEIEDYQPVALKPSVLRTEAVTQKAELPEAVAPPAKPAKPKPQTLRPAEPVNKPSHRMRMNWDAQALVRAQMQAQLEAQLDALDQAEIELKVAPKPARPTPAQAAEASTVSSARVRSRIKKFRTRYDAGARPEKTVTADTETPQPAAAPRSPVSVSQARKVQV